MKDEALLACGDEDSMNLLLGRYREALVRFCNKFVHDDERAEELAQETMLKVFLYRGRFDPTKPFRAWLWNMARNLCHNEYRRRTAHPEESKQTPLFDIFHTKRPPIVENMEHEEELQLLRDSIEKLPERQRETLALVLRGDMTYNDIAKVLGITRKGVRFRMKSAREKLKGMMVNDAV